ncbi:MAG: HEAT repeat domain-containing protein [Pirellulaceae bacterium]
MQQLAEMMVDSNESFKYVVAEQLALRNDQQRTALVPELMEMLRSRDEQIVLVAAETLGSIESEVADAASLLEHLLGHRIDEIAGAAESPLWRSRPTNASSNMSAIWTENRWSIAFVSALANYGHEAAPAA